MIAEVYKNEELAEVLSASTLIRKEFQNPANMRFALDMAERLKVPPMMILNNLDIKSGKMKFSSSFVIAAINASGKFTPLRFEISGTGDNMKGYAYATEIVNGEERLVIGPTVSVEMAKKEGWYTKPNSKWPTMTELLVSYRSATFFSRIYCPEILMEIQTNEEWEDIQPDKVAADSTAYELTKQLLKKS